MLARLQGVIPEEERTTPIVILIHEKPFGTLGTPQLRNTVIRADGLAGENPSVTILRRDRMESQISEAWAHTVGTPVETIPVQRLARDRDLAVNFGESMAISWSGYTEIPLPIPELHLQRLKKWQAVSEKDVGIINFGRYLKETVDMLKDDSYLVEVLQLPLAA